MFQIPILLYLIKRKRKNFISFVKFMKHKYVIFDNLGFDVRKWFNLFLAMIRRKYNLFCNVEKIKAINNYLYMNALETCYFS